MAASEPYRTVILFGPPGVGKGTQGRLLGTVPGFIHLATGDIFRSLDPESPMGRTFHQYSSRGELVPDEVTIAVWRDHMKKMIREDTYRPDGDLLVLDGIPRSLNQAKEMDKDIDVRAIVHLVAEDEDAMVRRMQRRARHEGRHDDSDEKVIRNRFNVYRHETFPVLEHFGKVLCRDINAVGSPGRVLCSILSLLVPIQEAIFPNALER